MLARLKTQLPLYALLILFLVPLLVALYLSFMGKSNLQILSTHTQGTLLKKPIAIHTLPICLHDPTNQAKWQMIYLKPTACDKTCEVFEDQIAWVYHMLKKYQPHLAKRSVSCQDVLPVPQGNLIILDPKGWLFIYYSPPIDARGIFNDLRKLLSLYSHT